MANPLNNEIRYLNPPTVEVKKKKYCRFKKAGIKYVDYKDAEFLKRFLNEQGKILPRRLTGTSLKFQKKDHTKERCESPLAASPMERYISNSLQSMPFSAYYNIIKR